MTQPAAQTHPPRTLEDLVALARLKGRTPMAVAAADDAFCLRAAAEAFERGFVEPILVGDPERIRRAADEARLDVTAFERVESATDAESASLAVRLVHDGRAGLLMKGSLATKLFLRAVVDREFGLRTRGLLSHVAAFEAPGEPRLVLLTDAAVNVDPHFTRKMEIVRNAVEVAQRLGIAEPKVALLAAVEKLDLPAMRATLDAEMLRRLGEAGQFGRAVLGGPMSIDAALSRERSAHKHMADPVAGAADVLVAPNIETANNLYKAITCIAGKEMAGAVVGSQAPIILASRADTAGTKLYSIAFGAVLSGSAEP